MYEQCLELFIDELGVPTKDPLYIVTAASIKEINKEKVRILADQIKFKYWGTTDVVFHSREIGLNLDSFSIFKSDHLKKEEFLKDLKIFLKKCPVIILSSVVDNVSARTHGWIQKSKFIKETSRILFADFAMITYCKSRTKGKIIIELDEAKEESYFKSFRSLLGGGIKGTPIKSADIRGIFTSISFVTKKNNDIETQLVDLFSYAVKCKYLRDIQSKNFVKDSYEDKIIGILEDKLFKVPPKASLKKKRILNKVKSFAVLP